jgi:lipoyl(octanoyl) transferase
MNQATSVIDSKIGEIEVFHSAAPVAYEEAIAWMEARAHAIRAGTSLQALWFLEHPPLFTAGTSAKPADMLDTLGFPVYQTGRGGQYTYHGPGQRVVYVMLDLLQRPAPKTRDVRAFVQDLEHWLIATLATFGVEGHIREGRVGVWVERPNMTEAKIAALGIRLRQWVSYHGIAINVSPDLSHFHGIVPCGIRDAGVTSFAALEKNISLSDLDSALLACFKSFFT